MPRSRIKARSKRSAKSGGHLFPNGVDQARRAFVRTFPCAPCLAAGLRQQTRTLACHLKSRGASGVDAGNLWPGCNAHHQEQHVTGIVTFQKRYRINLARICGRIEQGYLLHERFIA